MKRSAIILSFVLVSCVMSLSSAHAYDGYYGYGFPWFGYGNNGPAAYALGNIPAPPYFALHPPVYYSHPVARTYGSSPFAYSGNFPYQAQVAAPRLMANPRIELRQPAPKAKTAAHVAVTPVRIANPYYQAELSVEQGLVSQE